MSFPIKTNQLAFKCDYSAIDKQYDIFMVSTTDTYFKDSSLIFDTPLLVDSVCSIRFSYGKAFWVLMHHKDDNKMILKTALDKSDVGDKLTIEQQKSSEVYKDSLIQLLLNSLNHSDNKFLSFNNLTGHLYCFHPKWIKHSHKNNIDSIMKVPCVEIRVTHECRIQTYVRTFSAVILRKQMNFTKKRFEEYPQYVLSLHNTLRRRLQSDDGMAYIQRQTGQDRTEIPFLSVENAEKFAESKMGVLTEAVNRFNRKFNGIACLDFYTTNEYTALDYTNSTAKENKNVVFAALTKLPVKLIDCVSDDYSEAFCQRIADEFEFLYGLPMKRGKRISLDHFNVRVIHNKEYYEGMHDPHNDAPRNAAVQHITLEDFADNCESAIVTIVHELLIKQDLINRHISLFNWENIESQSNWVFGMPFNVSGVNHYLFMDIHPDGTFDIEEQKLDLFNMGTYSQCVSIFEDNAKKSEQVKGMIRNGDGKINLIRDTGWFSIPEIESIHQELLNGNTYLRGKDSRNELLSSCLDVKYLPANKCAYYFVGTIGNGMRATINRACNIRKIEPYGDAPIFFNQLLPLMNVSFVRNGQLTILPFPFKYLREYASLNGVG